MFAVVFVVRLIVADPVGAAADLYVFPVALIALGFGARAGVAAGLAGAMLLTIPLGEAGIDHSPLSWAARAVAMTAMGLVLGDASDRLAEAQRLRSAVALAAERHREAIEFNDGLVQGLAAAKWQLEAGRGGAALETLNETIATGEQLVSKLIREAAGATRAGGGPRAA
jgi:signal transduction histidine kinase